MKYQTLFQSLKRDAAGIYSEEELHKKLASGNRLRVKLGADPSRPNLHLGHTVVLRKLRLLQEAGHEIVFVIGDFTGMIGDPSGRSRTREALTLEQTRENGRTYFEQVTKILSPHKTSIVFNSQWLSDMKFEDVLNLCGKYTLARILERDDFAGRLGQNLPIGMHELIYPLIQGYDCVALCSDIEVGGTDQTFNLLVGRELLRQYGKTPQTVITFPILPGLDGTVKMSKSVGNTIDLCEAPDSMFEKCMRMPDGVLCDYMRLTTDLAEDVFLPLCAQDMRSAHLLFAQTITGMYHGAEAASAAYDRYEQVAAGREPGRMPEFGIERDENGIVDVLVNIGFAVSTSEARRLLSGGGIRADGQVVSDITHTLQSTTVLSRGKKRYARVVLHDSK